MYNDNAQKLIDNGYHPIPIAPPNADPEVLPKKCPVRFVPELGKHVKFKDWSNRSEPIMTPQADAGIGVRCGDNGLVAFDYDAEDAALVISEAFACPVNKAGERGWTAFFRADFAVSSEDFHDKDGLLALQVLSSGKQTVIPPSIHPDTKQSYRWTNGKTLYDTKVDELPLLPRDYRERILALGYLASKPKKDRVTAVTADTVNAADADSSLAELNALALKNLASWVPALGLYNCKRRMGRYPAYDAVPEWRPSTTGRPLEQRDRNLGIVGSGIKDFGTGESLSPIDVVMRKLGLGVHQAACYLEEKLPSQSPDIDIDIDKCVEAQDAPPTVPGDDDGNDNVREATPKRRRINPMPLILPAERDVPRRQFLYGMHYMRGTVSGTIGTGGTGKSTLGLIEAMGMAVGRDLLGNEIFKKPLRVWYHNAEETMDELVRRCAAICKHFKISQEDLGDNFLITNGFETPIKVAGGGRDVKIDAALRKEIIEVIGEEKIDVVVFDPLVAMHRVHEDFNSALDPVIRDAFGKIAHDTNCAIDLCHHTRKKPAGNDGEYTVADSRGGQSLIDALRGARVLNTMLKTEAANFDIGEDDRFDYMRLSRGKANMVRRGTIGWYRFVPTELDNGSVEEGIPGDTVAVLNRWDPPKDSDLVRQPTSDDRTYWLHVLKYGEHRYDARSPDWFGFKIAERLGADKKDPRQMKVVTAILDDMIEEGTFKIEAKRDEKRMLKKFVAPGVVAGVESL
jgi:hypothetical protein